MIDLFGITSSTGGGTGEDQTDGTGIGGFWIS
jgi:hypothetical protein